MRNIRLNCFVILLGGVIASGATGFAADSAKEKKDPFTREAEKGNLPGRVEKGVANIVLDFQLIEVPQKEVFKWEREGLNWSVWHGNANALIDGGGAKILISTSKVARSGQRSEVASQLQLAYPTESDVLDIDPKGPLFPAAFEYRKLGLILMADPVLMQGEENLNMSYMLEWSGYDGENLEGRTESNRVQNSDVVSPKFQVNKVSNSVDLEIGAYRMLTQFKGEDEENVVLVFSRFDLVTAAPLEDKKKMAEVEGIQVRASWVEMPADMWHDWLRRGSLSALFGGGAWDKVSEQIEKDRETKILASPTLLAQSGQRAKVEATSEVVTSFRDFEPPKVLGGISDTKGAETEKIGATFEADPILGMNGIIELNFASSSSSLCGSTVSYRREENGKWVPSVSHLKVFEDRITTQVALDEGMKLLTAVMTPSNEDGSLDYTRKILFFVSNETFQSP